MYKRFLSQNVDISAKELEEAQSVEGKIKDFELRRQNLRLKIITNENDHNPLKTLVIPKMIAQKKLIIRTSEKSRDAVAYTWTPDPGMENLIFKCEYEQHPVRK